MDLTPAERSHLATFFAKRFPTASDRSELARAAAVVEPTTNPTSARAAWERLLADAEAAGRLARLAHAAADRLPHDTRLRHAANLIGPPPSPWPRLALATAVVAVPVMAVFAVGVIAVSVGAFNGSPAAAAPQVVASPVVDVENEVPSASTDAVAAAMATDVPQPQGVPAADEVDGPVADAPVVEPTDVGTADDEPVRTRSASGAAPTATVSGPANFRGRCTQSGGGLIGYWYAGNSAPGGQGDVVSLPQAMNVRAYVPSLSNDFDARGPIRCVLEAGDRVRLSHAPVPVPVDAFWVPLYSGDLITED